MNKIDVIFDKLDSFVNRESTSDIDNISIYQIDENLYEIFNKYIIEKNQKIFEVTKKYSHLNKIFSSLQNAVTFCILDHRNKINDAKRLEELDKILNSLNASINLHETLISKTKNSDNILIYYSKLTDEKLKKKSLIKELSVLVNESKIWQNKQFAKIPKL